MLSILEDKKNIAQIKISKIEKNFLKNEETPFKQYRNAEKIIEERNLPELIAFIKTKELTVPIISKILKKCLDIKYLDALIAILNLSGSLNTNEILHLFKNSLKEGNNENIELLVGLFPFIIHQEDFALALASFGAKSQIERNFPHILGSITAPLVFAACKSNDLNFVQWIMSFVPKEISAAEDYDKVEFFKVTLYKIAVLTHFESLDENGGVFLLSEKKSLPFEVWREFYRVRPDCILQSYNYFLHPEEREWIKSLLLSAPDLISPKTLNAVIAAEMTDSIKDVFDTHPDLEIDFHNMWFAYRTNNLELIKLLFDLRPEYNDYGILNVMSVPDVASLLKRYPELTQRLDLDSIDTKNKLNKLFLLMPELAIPTPEI